MLADVFGLSRNDMNVLLIIFNRPNLTARVFEAVRKSRPEKLFIAADGPRTGKTGEVDLCEESRKIVRMVDWPCDIKTRFQTNNLGCKMHVGSAISWFFDNVEEGIVLEDDCLPGTAFFSFCDELLEKYRSNENIMHINGTTFLTTQEISDTLCDYHFSRCAHVWGWATWRRAWNKYDLNMLHIDSLAKSDFARNIFLKNKYLDFWIKHFKHISKNNIDTWDAQWQYSILNNNGLVISPNENLVKNIGFGFDATHTSSENGYMLPVGEIPDPLRGPDKISVDMNADSNLMEKIYIRSFRQKMMSAFNKILNTFKKR
jgi:hypothetical protein